MSALGQKQTFAAHKPMSALIPKADMCSYSPRAKRLSKLSDFKAPLRRGFSCGPLDCVLRCPSGPLWVISGHVQCKTSCPLCANSGHCSGVESRRPRLRFLQKQGRKLLVSFQEFFDVIFHRDLGMGKRPIMSGSDKSKKR